MSCVQPAPGSARLPFRARPWLPGAPGPPGAAGPRPGSIDPVILAALITSIGPRYAVGTTVGHLDLTALEVPCPDPGTARWLSQTLETLGKQRREALAALRALDELRTELVEGLGSEAIRLESHTPGEEGHRW